MYSKVIAFTVTADAMNNTNAYNGKRINNLTATPTYPHHRASSESGLPLRICPPIPHILADSPALIFPSEFTSASPSKPLKTKYENRPCLTSSRTPAVWLDSPAVKTR